jgi:hypothetical protein
MKNALLLAAALALIALAVACNGDDGDNGGEDGGTTTVPRAGATISIQQDGTPTAGDTPITIDVVVEEVCQPNPAPATPDFQVIDQPAEGHTVTSPVTISGQVLAFEGSYQVAILDAVGDPIAEPLFGTAEAGEIGQLAPFSIDVPFEVDEETPACIWVFELSARDGSQIHVGQIPVLLSP